MHQKTNCMFTLNQQKMALNYKEAEAALKPCAYCGNKMNIGRHGPFGEYFPLCHTPGCIMGDCYMMGFKYLEDIVRILNKRPEVVEEECVWRASELGTYYTTNCGYQHRDDEYEVNDEALQKYCPYCGRKKYIVSWEAIKRAGATMALKDAHIYKKKNCTGDQRCRDEADRWGMAPCDRCKKKFYSDKYDENGDRKPEKGE